MNRFYETTDTLAMLELTRRQCPAAVFIYVSTNKVYGDVPNRVPLVASVYAGALRAPMRFA